MATTTSSSGGGGISSSSSDEELITKLKTSLQREKAAKRKMYSYLVKIADELKTLRNESEQLINAAEYARKAWYEGGMWRGPNVLPGAYGGSIAMGNTSGGNNDGGGDNNGAAEGNNNEEGASTQGGGMMFVPRAPVSLSDLFLDIVSKLIELIESKYIYMYLYNLALEILMYTSNIVSVPKHTKNTIHTQP